MKRLITRLIIVLLCLSGLSLNAQIRPNESVAFPNKLANSQRKMINIDQQRPIPAVDEKQSLTPNKKISRTLTPASEKKSRTLEGPQSFTTAWLWLGFVLFLILILAKVWKKHGPIVKSGIPADALEFLGRRPLDHRQSIQLIRCGTRIIILGVTPEGIHPLSEITDPVEVDLISGLCRQTSEQEGISFAFRNLLSRPESSKKTTQSLSRAAKNTDSLYPSKQSVRQTPFRVDQIHEEIS